MGHCICCATCETCSPEGVPDCPCQVAPARSHLLRCSKGKSFGMLCDLSAQPASSSTACSFVLPRFAFSPSHCRSTQRRMRVCAAMRDEGELVTDSVRIDDSALVTCWYHGMSHTLALLFVLCHECAVHLISICCCMS